MKNLFNSLYNFITSLSPIDIVFLVAVLVLIVLIVVMIYILRVEEDSVIQYQEDKNNDNSNSRSIPPVAPVMEDNLDLASISKEIENTPSKVIELTPYEEEQEEKAIISYDELISNTGKMKLKYEEENISDGLVVKKVNMENLNIPTDDMPKMASMLSEKIKSAPVISYEKEEAFLAALKKMQKMLY